MLSHIFIVLTVLKAFILPILSEGNVSETTTEVEPQNTHPSEEVPHNTDPSELEPQTTHVSQEAATTQNESLITSTPPPPTKSVLDAGASPTTSLDYEDLINNYKGRPVPPELKDLFEQGAEKEDDLHYCMRELTGCIHVHKLYPFCAKLGRRGTTERSFQSICEMSYLNCREGKDIWHFYYDGPCNNTSEESLYDELYKVADNYQWVEPTA